MVVLKCIAILFILVFSGCSAETTAGTRLNLIDTKDTGDVTSPDNKDIAGSQKYLPLPEVILKDFNPKSSTYNEEIDTSTAFQGKFVVVHMGAGW